MQDIYVNQMQISCLEIFVKYSKFLVREAANIDDIPGYQLSFVRTDPHKG